MPDWLVGLLAIYGAALSTVVAILQIGRERRRDKAAVRVEVYFGVVGAPDHWTDMIMARASNVGLRDVELTSAQFILTGNKALQPTDVPELPKTLRPTQSVDVWIPSADLAHLIANESGTAGRAVRLEGATFKDGTGKRYRGTVDRKLRKHLRDEGIEAK